MKQRSVRETILIGSGILVFVLFLVLPFLCVVFGAFSKGIGAYVTAVRDPYTVKALILTLRVCGIALLLNTVFGLFAAWGISCFRFRGKKLLMTLIDLPLTVSPVIAGLMFLLAFGKQSLLDPYLRRFGIHIVFAVPGIVLATVFVTFPIILKEVLPVLEAEGTDEEEAAALMGASLFTIFRKVTFPKIRFPLLYGIVLCAARSLGEFGAVSVLSGHLRGLTNTLPLHVEILFNEFHTQAAFAAASVLMFLSMLLLIGRNYLEKKMRQEKER